VNLPERPRVFAGRWLPTVLISLSFNRLFSGSRKWLLMGFALVAVHVGQPSACRSSSV